MRLLFGFEGKSPGISIRDVPDSLSKCLVFESYWNGWDPNWIFCNLETTYSLLENNLNQGSVYRCFTTSTLKIRNMYCKNMNIVKVFYVWVITFLYSINWRSTMQDCLDIRSNLDNISEWETIHYYYYTNLERRNHKEFCCTLVVLSRYWDSFYVYNHT